LAKIVRHSTLKSVGIEKKFDSDFGESLNLSSA